MNFMCYLTEDLIILVPVLWIIGIFLKNTPKVKDWSIPWILLLLALTASILKIGLKMEAIIQGVLVTGTSVLSHQLIKQTRRKK